MHIQLVLHGVIAVTPCIRKWFCCLETFSIYSDQQQIEPFFPLFTVLFFFPLFFCLFPAVSCHTLRKTPRLLLPVCPSEPRGNGDYLLSFIGYAPQENPEVVIYVVIDEPNVENQELSSYVLELSQKIMAEAFPYLNITRNGDALPEDSGVREDVQQDFDENFEDTYSNQDGAYIDPNYQPDYDSWATSPESSETTE